MDKPRPKRIFKFHKINGYLYDLLENNKLWFSHQNDLNDPFDCRYALSSEYLTKTFKNAANKMLPELRRMESSLEKLSDEQFIQSMLANSQNTEFMGRLYGMLFGSLGWSVCCFTTDFESEIMWGHYGDSNKGVCLEFDLTSTPEFHEKLFQVKYDDKSPQINSQDDIPEALLTKRSAWKDEHEWRIISNVSGVRFFNKESLTAIYFGCYVTMEKIDLIRQLMVNSGYKKVQFKQFDICVGGVKMNNEDLKPLTSAKNP